MSLHLDVRQTRRFYLAGTVSLPITFPSSGTIAIVAGTVRYTGDAGKEKTFVQLRETCGLGQVVTRVVLKEHVNAIYFPGVAGHADVEPGRPGPVGVCDFEEGIWFLKPQIDANAISDRLGADIGTLESGVQGIVFVPEHLPVLTITECTQTAREIGGSTTHGWCECEC